MFQVGGVLLLLLLTLILICCRRRKEKEMGKVKEDKEEGDTATAVDNDSGNNTAESCSDCEERKSLLTPLENKEEEEEEKVVDEEAGLVEAQKPKFRSPLWLEDIHTNRLFNKQKSILTEEVSLFRISIFCHLQLPNKQLSQCSDSTATSPTRGNPRNNPTQA